MIRNEDGSVACICHEHKPACDCIAEQLRPVRQPTNVSAHIMLGVLLGLFFFFLYVAFTADGVF